MSDGDLLESDRLDDTPHPREATRLAGHQAAEKVLLDAYRSERMHHAWIIGGEEGIGKATLAYRLARFILSHPDPASSDIAKAANLSVDPDTPAARRIAHQAHPDLFVLRRGYTKDGRNLMSEISVGEVRRLVSFFTTTAGEGGWRIAIIDTADELNSNAANALLKVLEEPPARSLFLILSTAPKRLLSTIRSRCRTLLLKPLDDGEVLEVLQSLPDLTAETDPDELRRVAEASSGSVRRAAAMLSEDSLALRDVLTGMLERLPVIDHAEVLALADKVAGREGAPGFGLMIGFIQDWLHERLTLGAARGDARLAAWAALWEKTARTAREAEIYNLDRRPLVLAIFSDLAAAVRG
jgi:DNA polymerase-3 subunit delta'